MLVLQNELSRTVAFYVKHTVLWGKAFRMLEYGKARAGT
jgi:hypothetical protein